MWVEADQAHLYYEYHDEAPSRDTLVFLHGVGGNHASWFHQVAHWRSRYRLLIADARGFGRSTDPGRLGRDRFVEDLETILDHAGVERAVLVAQSMGGGTAVTFTCRYPERVRGLVLVDTLFGFELPAAQAQRMQALSDRNAQRSQIERVLGRTFIEKHPDQVALYSAIASFNITNVRTLSGHQQQHSPAALAATGVPILLVAGDEDVLFPAREIALLHEQIAGSGFHCFSGVGHSPYFEAPDRFNRLLDDWWRNEGVLS
ncbi:alpha/beta fold hydrolase [Alloalcanivorax sp. C16-2]|uniref:alpha/beta fold hydrolase n=1 Tax=Alloalcanivorax TaxID=3020832 RepID=UPI0019343F9E|nr:alpha/beta hydrolase [Alloalcanivorax marinus]MBL7250106.1 alpha/beta fold hydrolase [Alloalcanivorax marinus]